MLSIMRPKLSSLEHSFGQKGRGGGSAGCTNTKRWLQPCSQAISGRSIAPFIAKAGVNNTARWPTASIVAEGAPFSPTASVA